MNNIEKHIINICDKNSVDEIFFKLKKISPILYTVNSDSDYDLFITKLLDSLLQFNSKYISYINSDECKKYHSYDNNGKLNIIIELIKNIKNSLNKLITHN